jgi:hypothetical protein
MAPAETIIVWAPSTADLFEDVNGFGDISRYQSLVMCTATAVTFFVSFFDTWSVPDLPPQVLQLLGTSLAVYLGVKGFSSRLNNCYKYLESFFDARYCPLYLYAKSR